MDVILSASALVICAHLNETDEPNAVGSFVVLVVVRWILTATRVIPDTGMLRRECPVAVSARVTCLRDLLICPLCSGREKEAVAFKQLRVNAEDARVGLALTNPLY